jgi:hypothetical protein
MLATVIRSTGYANSASKPGELTPASPNPGHSRQFVDDFADLCNAILIVAMRHSPCHMGLIKGLKLICAREGAISNNGN